MISEIVSEDIYIVNSINENQYNITKLIDSFFTYKQSFTITMTRRKVIEVGDWIDISVKTKRNKPPTFSVKHVYTDQEKQEINDKIVDIVRDVWYNIHQGQEKIGAILNNFRGNNVK